MGGGVLWFTVMVFVPDALWTSTFSNVEQVVDQRLVDLCLL